MILLRQTAAQYLGMAVRELFPKVHLVGGQGTSRFFYYDFLFPFPFQKEMLPRIEERMHAILREKAEVRRIEMVPSNAAMLFESREQPLIAERLRTVSAATVPLCQIGESIDYCPEPFSLNNTFKFFKLIEALEIGGVTRIVGVLEENKELLKQKVKSADLAAHNHLTLIESLFFPLEEDSRWVWLPKAKKIRDRLCAFWKEAHVEQNFSLLSSSSTTEEEMTHAHVAFLRSKNFSKTAELGTLSFGEEGAVHEGLFSANRCFTDRGYLFCPKEKLLEEAISSLQFILKIPKILCFEFEILLSVSSAGNPKGAVQRESVDVFKQALGKLGLSFTTCKEYHRDLHARIDVLLFDSLGRKWRGPFLGSSRSDPKMDQGKHLLIRSAFGSMERLMGLLLESEAGKIPFWLAPEQVRILLVSENAASWAEEVYRELRTRNIRATVERETDALKVRVSRATREKVPFIVLIGEQEIRERSLTVREGTGIDQKGLSQKSLSLDGFCEMIQS